MCVSSYALLRCVPRHICSIPLCVLLWLGRYLIVLVPVREVSLSLSLSLSLVRLLGSTSEISRECSAVQLVRWGCDSGGVRIRPRLQERGDRRGSGLARWCGDAMVVCMVDAEMPRVSG